jgi:hypothetical protein
MKLIVIFKMFSGFLNSYRMCERLLSVKIQVLQYFDCIQFNVS